MSAAADTLDVTRLITADEVDASRMVTKAFLEGDERQARAWAIEYAIHCDNRLTRAENRVVLDGYRWRDAEQLKALA
jgi:hypothetical protein